MLIVAITVVSTYAPEINVRKIEPKGQEKDFRYEKPEIMVQSAKKYETLGKVVAKLEDSSSVKTQKKLLDQLKENIKEAKGIVKEEVEDAKNRTDSFEIKVRAEKYKEKVEVGFDELENKIDVVAQKLNQDNVSLKTAQSGIREIKTELNKMQKYEEPEIQCNEEAHGIAETYKAGRIVGEKTVDSDIDISSAVPAKKYQAYLELSEPLKHIADSLTTPAEVYEYVRNNYRYKQYRGLKLGANGTYQQHEGNDFDQSALLIALFRYKGIQAKFVVGNIDVDIDKVIRWLGVQDAKAAVDAMSAVGVPTQYGVDAKGNIS